MARNIKLQILRGVRANMPTLNQGELYYCTDTNELYVGDSGTNQRAGVSAVIGIGTGKQSNVTAPAKGSGTGPANPTTVVAFAQANFAGVMYWIALHQ